MSETVQIVFVAVWLYRRKLTARRMADTTLKHPVYRIIVPDTMRANGDAEASGGTKHHGVFIPQLRV